MKKFIALLLTLVMCFALAATASAESPAEPEYTEITMKLSHHNAVDQPIGVALDAWAKMVMPFCAVLCRCDRAAVIIGVRKVSPNSVISVVGRTPSR